MVGGLIMAHGDDNGLRVPPRIAPIQAVVLLVRDDADCAKRAQGLHSQLLAAGVRSRLDADVNSSFGRRATEWELKGVPVRIEVGPRDLAQGKVTLVRRDTSQKVLSDVAAAVAEVQGALASMQAEMLASTLERTRRRTADVKSVGEALEAAQRGFARMPLDALGGDGEALLGKQGVTVRCVQRGDGSVPASENEKGLYAIIARSY